MFHRKAGVDSAVLLPQGDHPNSKLLDCLLYLAKCQLANWIETYFEYHLRQWFYEPPHVFQFLVSAFFLEAAPKKNLIEAMMQSADSDVPRGSSKLRPSCRGTMKAPLGFVFLPWLVSTTFGLSPLHSEGVSRGKKKNNSFFGEKNCFSWGLVPQLNLELTFFCNFWGHQRAMWQISTGFTSPQSCCNIHHHHLWPSNSHLKHHGSPHVHEGQIAKVHAEPGFQRNLWRNDTCRKETLILDRPTSGYHEGYHQKISCHTSALFARPEMFEPFQLPAFEKKNSATLRFPKKEKSSKVVNFWKTQSYGGNPFLVKLEIATSQCIPGTVCYITACFFKGFLSKLVNGSGL